MTPWGETRIERGLVPGGPGPSLNDLHAEPQAVHPAGAFQAEQGLALAEAEADAAVVAAAEVVPGVGILQDAAVPLVVLGEVELQAVGDVAVEGVAAQLRAGDRDVEAVGVVGVFVVRVGRPSRWPVR